MAFRAHPKQHLEPSFDHQTRFQHAELLCDALSPHLGCKTGPKRKDPILGRDHLALQ